MPEWTREQIYISVIPQVDIGPRGQLQVVIQLPYELVSEFKSKLEWRRCHYRWDKEHHRWLVDLEALPYVAAQLGIAIPPELIEIFGEMMDWDHLA